MAWQAQEKLFPNIITTLDLKSHIFIMDFTILIFIFVSRLQWSHRKVWPCCAKPSQFGSSIPEWNRGTNSFISQWSYFCPPTYIHWRSIWWMAEAIQCWWDCFICFLQTQQTRLFRWLSYHFRLRTWHI